MDMREMIAALSEAAQVGAETYDDLAASTDPDEGAVRAEYERQARGAWEAVEAARAYLATR